MHFASPRTALLLATLITLAYTALVWWLGHPFVKAMIARPRRRSSR